MHEEAADKFLTMQLHDFGLIVPVVFVTKVHSLLFNPDDALVADGDTVTVTRQVTIEKLQPGTTQKKET
jgi:hypothetical protein